MFTEIVTLFALVHQCQSIQKPQSELVIKLPETIHRTTLEPLDVVTFQINNASCGSVKDF